MYLCKLFITSDDSLGRFDTQSLSQQSLIELLVADLEDVGIAKDADGNFLDISDWSVLKMDETGNVVGIHLDTNAVDYTLLGDPNRSIKDGCFCEDGLMELRYVPPTVRTLEVAHMGIDGTLETERLPAVLEILRIPFNNFQGTFAIEGLPQEIKSVLILGNNFEGSLALESLPTLVEQLEASGNRFSGSVNLSALPPKLIGLSLANNQLSGKIELRNIPKTLTWVELQSNPKFDTSKAIIDGKYVYNHLSLPFVLEKKLFDDVGAPVEGCLKGLRYK